MFGTYTYNTLAGSEWSEHICIYNQYQYQPSIIYYDCTYILHTLNNTINVILNRADNEMENV